MFPRAVNLVVLFVAMACFYVVTACTESLHTKRMPDATREILQKDFLFSEVLEIAKGKPDHTSVAHNFTARPSRYKHVGSERQGKMKVEGYSVLDSQSPIIGYSLFFHNETGSLAIIDATVNPLNQEAIEKAEKLIARAFDSVEAGGNSKLYFLGIYALDQQRVLKVMVRKATASFGPDYAIRYAIS